VIVTLYTKQDCRLCEEAEDHLRSLQQSIRFDFRLVYVEDDPASNVSMGDRVPVVLVDGKEVASAPIDQEALAAALSA
jgi:glutaredoxin